MNSMQNSSMLWMRQHLFFASDGRHKEALLGRVRLAGLTSPQVLTTTTSFVPPGATPPWQRRKSLTISRIQIPPVPPTSLDVVWNKRDFVEEYPLRSHPFHKRIRLRMYCWLDQIFTRVAESGHKCSGATSQFVAFGTDSICRIWWPIRSKFHPQSIDSHNEATRRFGHGVETVICTWN